MTAHPEPMIGYREALLEEIPRGAKPVLKLARAGGWLSLTTYARGSIAVNVNVEGKRETEFRVVDSIVVRLRKDGRQAAAWWEDGAFGAAYLVDPDVGLFRLNSKQLKQRLVACPFGWSDGWGEHVCQRPESHDGRHTCRCDAMTDGLGALSWPGLQRHEESK